MANETVKLDVDAKFMDLQNGMIVIPAGTEVIVLDWLSNSTAACKVPGKNVRFTVQGLQRPETQ